VTRSHFLLLALLSSLVLVATTAGCGVGIGGLYAPEEYRWVRAISVPEGALIEYTDHYYGGGSWRPFVENTIPRSYNPPESDRIYAPAFFKVRGCKKKGAFPGGKDPIHGPWLRARWKDGEVSDKVLIHRRRLWYGTSSNRPLRLTFRRGAKPVVQEEKRKR
jgi:hypothetical protein